MHLPSSAASFGYLPLGMTLVFFMTSYRYGGSSKTVWVNSLTGVSELTVKSKQRPERTGHGKCNPCERHLAKRLTSSSDGTSVYVSVLVHDINALSVEQKQKIEE